jgi:hypothetical protein
MLRGNLYLSFMHDVDIADTFASLCRWYRKSAPWYGAQRPSPRHRSAVCLRPGLLFFRERLGGKLTRMATLMYRI